MRRASTGGGFGRHQRLPHALRRRFHLRSPRRHRRACLHSCGGIDLPVIRSGLRLPCTRRHDFRQLETLEYPRCIAVFALFKIIGSYSGSIPFLPKFENLNQSEYLYLMVPYVVTMILLILTSKKSRAPKAEVFLTIRGAAKQTKPNAQTIRRRFETHSLRRRLHLAS